MKATLRNTWDPKFEFSGNLSKFEVSSVPNLLISSAKRHIDPGGACGRPIGGGGGGEEGRGAGGEMANIF